MKTSQKVLITMQVTVALFLIIGSLSHVDGVNNNINNDNDNDMVDTNNKCSYFAEFGYAVPTETCTKQQFKNVNDIESESSSIIYHCIEKVENQDFWEVETHYFDNSQCIGDALNIERKICHESYCNCYGNPQYCDTATITQTNCDNKDLIISKYIYVIDICINYDGGSSTKLQCNHDNQILIDKSYLTHSDCNSIINPSIINPSINTFNHSSKCDFVECNYIQNNANRLSNSIIITISTLIVIIICF